ncbi:patatin-like phospholipase family protein [Enterovibrio makurazakiensis]|uniref:Patatin-like phospholipase family protein n=1 Tax=Enterovibrio gelatinilyticus TaxID=2899819 RepID=A0ABT5QW57_9GAMM|nr:patatin-like phospholipase family protein [Enterovibrio sp. ZSDZ42]MDD1791969.1 patatin-like phospholipase family protein [Enterovibrio sp. ZSDZ42]
MFNWLVKGRLVTAALLLSAVLPASLALGEENSQRPTIGLVLGGGGAKGAAHVGVLKALEELRIPVDYIAGTSMGAYVGGLYAIGMTADEISVLIETTNWSEGYQDRVYRGDRRTRDKEHEDRYNLSTNFGFDLKSLKTPQGIVQGQNMIRILRESTGNLPSFESFDQMVVPYRAVATDIERLVPVVIGDGQLTEAMLASMAVPGALPPVELEGRYLVDGGSVNNMPVDVAKALGADIVIAVDISTDYSPAAELGSYLSVMNQLVNYMVRNSTDQQIANMTDSDVLLTPDVGDMETTEFDRMPEAYEKGYQVTFANKEALAPLRLNSGQYQAYIEKKQLRRRLMMYGDILTVDNIVINNDTSFSDDVLKARLSLQTGRIDSKKLEQSVQNLYALDRFETVRYHLEHQGDENVLVVDVKEKSWGPNFVDFRFALEDSFESGTNFSAGVSINSTGLTDYGAEIRSLFELGTDKRAQAELYLPFSADQLFFAQALGGLEIRERDAYFRGEEPNLEDETFTLGTRFSEVIAEVGLGWQPQLWGEFMVGYRYLDGEEEIAGGYAKQHYVRQMPFVSMTLDTLDSRVFPNRGGYLTMSLGYARDELDGSDGGAKSEASVLNIEGIYAKNIGKHTMYGKAKYGTINARVGNVAIEPHELGGFLNLSGIPRDSLWANNIAFGTVVYRYRLLDNDFGLFKSPVYLGTSLEYGGVWNNPDFSLKEVPFYMAGSIFAGVDSPLGPIIIAYGRTENDLDSFYFILGTEF